MTDSSNAPCCWVADTLNRAYPESAGVTLGAIEALSSEQSFSRAQLAYVADLMFRLGAAARQEADAAELKAWRETRATGGRYVIVRPRTQAYLDARRAARLAVPDRQNEYFWLRTRGSMPEPWAGGDAEAAMDRYMWEADRPDHVAPAGPLRVRRTRDGLVWADGGER